jgi:uncharacterized membrane protein YbhN (UPF0104 family)
MQLNKNIKIFINYFLGPLMFAWLAFSIYRQIIRQPGLEESWQLILQSVQSYKIIFLILVVFLLPLNWGLEAWKWRLSINTFFPLRFWQAYKAVLSGVSFSVTMPNRVGEYLGRMLYMPEGNRLKTISVTLVCSFAQLLITIIVGTIGLIILKKQLLEHFSEFRIWYQFVVYGLIALGWILAILYFNISRTVNLFRRWISSERHVYLVEALKAFHSELLMRILFLSFLRYLVFVVQYILIFYLFGVHVSAEIIFCVMSVVFLAMAVIPSIALLEVGLRGEISILLMGMFSSNTLGIGFTSIIIWLVNLILPAVVGSLLILNLRAFGKKMGDGR